MIFCFRYGYADVDDADDAAGRTTDPGLRRPTGTDHGPGQLLRTRLGTDQRRWSVFQSMDLERQGICPKHRLLRLLSFGIFDVRQTRLVKQIFNSLLYIL